MNSREPVYVHGRDPSGLPMSVDLYEIAALKWLTGTEPDQCHVWLKGHPTPMQFEPATDIRGGSSLSSYDLLRRTVPLSRVHF